jgi:hypothetical protein
VGARAYWDGIGCDVDAEGVACSADARIQRMWIAVDFGKIKKHICVAKFSHPRCDGAAYDISRRQFGIRMSVLHESLAVAIPQDAAASANNLANQYPCGARDVQARWMKLIELHVAYETASSQAHGKAVAGGKNGVGSLAKELACPACGEHDLRGFKGHDLATVEPGQEAAGCSGVVHQNVKRKRVVKASDCRFICYTLQQ